MKIQCEVCEKAEAEVLCCADEAVLCRGCDEKVHAANKLSQRHQRVSLLKQALSSSSSSSSHIPLCDICKERNGYFFCMEDRALLCKHCDESVHKASPYVSTHQRFLIAGVKVALQSLTDNNITSTSLSNFPTSHEESSKAAIPLYQSANTSAETTASFSGEPKHVPNCRPHWPLDEILNNQDFNYFY